MRKICVLGALTLALAGCAIPPPAPTVVNVGQYDGAAVAWSRAVGTGAIEGQAVLRTRGGDAKSCAGMRAYLIPYSKYGANRLKALYGNEVRSFVAVRDRLARPITFEPNEPAYFEDTRTEVCDSQGNFKFAKIPDGNWWVLTDVIWQVGAVNQGGGLMEMVTIKAGETKRVVLSP